MYGPAVCINMYQGSSHHVDFLTGWLTLEMGQRSGGRILILKNWIFGDYKKNLMIKFTFKPQVF